MNELTPEQQLLFELDNYQPEMVLKTPGPWTHLLWDMDGTLLNSVVAIERRLRETMLRFGVTPPTDHNLRYLIGPPTGSSLARFIGPDHIEQAREFYHSLSLRDGLIDQHLFSWIPHVLAELYEAGIPMAVATSKPQAEAERICQAFEIDHYFAAIVGASEARSDKAGVIAEGLKQLGVSGAATSEQPVMIGDRYFDTEGALRNNIPTILVRWGYAYHTEFAGAMYTVADGHDLLGLLRAPA